MNRWVIIAAVVGGTLVLCCGGTLVLGLVADDGGGGDFAGARSVPSGCSDAIDGWHQSIAEGGLVLTREGVTAELPWPFPITDALRSGDSELNILNAVIGARYEPGQLQRGQYGELWLSGPVTERAGGKTVYVAFTSGAQSGIANPVVVFAPDAATIGRYSSFSALSAIYDLNRFSLSCAELEGHWKSGFSTAAERYAIGTGQYLGAEAVAAWRDLQLGSGSYERESSAYVNRMFSKRKDSGSWSHDEWSLRLEPEGDEAIAYNAALIAVQNGFLLRLQNQKFTSDIEEFRKVE